MIRYLIVDDEGPAHELIEGYCELLPHLTLAGHCYDALEAMQFLQQQNVDLMFLDLQMPRLKGFEFLRTLTHPPQTIVTTAHQEFALEGYEHNVADYLLKPFRFERFVKAVNKALNHSTSSTPAAPQGSAQAPARFFIKGDRKYHQILVEQILFIEAYGNYSKIHLADQMILSHKKISDLEAMLSPTAFLRVHKSYLVALDKITSIEGNRILLGQQEVAIGQTYKSTVRRLLED